MTPFDKTNQITWYVRLTAKPLEQRHKARTQVHFCVAREWHERMTLSYVCVGLAEFRLRHQELPFHWFSYKQLMLHLYIYLAVRLDFSCLSYIYITTTIILTVLLCVTSANIFFMKEGPLLHMNGCKGRSFATKNVTIEDRGSNPWRPEGQWYTKRVILVIQ